MTRQEATEFYRSHSKAVYNTALRIVRDPEEAEEIMQDTFMKYFTKGVPGLSEARKAAWLRTTCIRMGIDFLRRRKKGLELFVERIPDEAEEEEDLPESMDVVIVSREDEEKTTVIGTLDTRTGEIRMNRGSRTFDLKGRGISGKPKAKGVYLKK